MKESTVINFLKNPVNYFKDIYKNYQNEKLAKEAISQHDYFINMLRWIAQTENQLLIYGYDNEFMELKETQKEIKNAIKGIGYFRENGPVKISAIFSESQGSSFLEKLANETTFISVFKTPENLSRGFIVYDEWGVNFWDKNRKTNYSLEKDIDIIWRSSIRNNLIAEKMIEKYENLIEEIQNKCLSKSIFAQKS